MDHRGALAVPMPLNMYHGPFRASRATTSIHVQALARRHELLGLDTLYGQQLAHRSRPQLARSLLPVRPLDHAPAARLSPPPLFQSPHARASTTMATGGRTDEQQLMISAASDGDILALKRLLANGTALVNGELEATDAQGCTALIAAARAGHVDVVEALLSAGANVDVCDGSGTTALAAAALAGHEDVVGMLIEWGADPDTRMPEVINGVVVYEAGWSDNSGGLGAHVWDAAIALSAFVTCVGEGQRTSGETQCRLPELRGAQCLELGAGSGLVGMALGMQGARVMCTDGDPALLELIETNAAANGLSSRVRTRVIDWADPATYLSITEDLQLVAAADTIYKKTGLAFAAAIAAHIPRGSATPAIIAYQHRDDGTMPFFLEMMKQGFLLERFCDTAGSAIGSSSPDDYADGEFVQMDMDSARALTPRYKLSAGRLDSIQILRASRKL